MERKLKEKAMKTKLSIIVAALILLGACNVQATSIVFYEDGIIQNGNEYDFVSVRNDATVDMTGGVITNQLTANDYSTVNIFNGSVGLIEAWNYSTVNLHGGTISNYLLAYGDDSLTVNIYGYGFDYNPLAGDYGGGQLTGFWLDDTPFSIDLFGDPGGPGGAPIDTYSHITLIPEPATILLLSLGGLFLRSCLNNQKIYKAERGKL